MTEEQKVPPVKAIARKMQGKWFAEVSDKEETSTPFGNVIYYQKYPINARYQHLKDGEEIEGEIQSCPIEGVKSFLPAKRSPNPSLNKEEGKEDQYDPKPGQYGNRNPYEFKKLSEGDFSNVEAPDKILQSELQPPLPEQGKEIDALKCLIKDTVEMMRKGNFNEAYKNLSNVNF